MKSEKNKHLNENSIIIKEGLKDCQPHVKENTMSIYSDMIHPCYYHPELLKYIRSLVEEGYSTYSMLDEPTQELVSAKCIEFLGSDIYECIFEESKNINLIMHHMKKYLQTGDNDYALDLSATLSKNIIEYFRRPLDTLFAEVYREWEAECYIDAGFYPKVDSQTGEIKWAA